MKGRKLTQKMKTLLTSQLLKFHTSHCFLCLALSLREQESKKKLGLEKAGKTCFYPSMQLVFWGCTKISQVLEVLSERDINTRSELYIFIGLLMMLEIPHGQY